METFLRKTIFFFWEPIKLRVEDILAGNGKCVRLWYFTPVFIFNILFPGKENGTIKQEILGKETSPMGFLKLKDIKEDLVETWARGISEENQSVILASAYLSLFAQRCYKVCSQVIFVQHLKKVLSTFILFSVICYYNSYAKWDIYHSFSLSTHSYLTLFLASFIISWKAWYLLCGLSICLHTSVGEGREDYLGQLWTVYKFMSAGLPRDFTIDHGLADWFENICFGQQRLVIVTFANASRMPDSWCRYDWNWTIIA